jgi:4-amino-4-deoxy-L-arabinose transferase-like glycosyltransferase
MTAGGSRANLGAAVLVPVLLCLVGLALRLWGLGDAALWVDESFTWTDYRQPLDLILGARLNVHPPAYGLLMHAWMPLGGEGEYALRLPAALLSTLVVPSVWRLGVRLGGTPTGWLAALLVAVAPLGLGFAREARMYGPLAAEAALVLLLADRIARRPGPAVRAGLLAATAIALLTHYTAVAAWAAGGLRTLPRSRRSVLGWVAAQALVGAVALAWALRLWANRDAWGGLVWLPWTGRTRLRDMALDWITAMAGLPVGPNGLGQGQLTGDGLLRLGLVALFAATLALGALAALRPGRRSLGLSLLLLALGPAAAIAALEYARPGWHVRFVLVGMPAALLLAALGATASRGRLWPLSAGLTAALVVGQLWGLALRPPPDRESWRAVAALLRREAGPGHVALAGVGSLVGYYLEPVLPVRQRPVAIGRPPEEAAAELAGAVAGATVIWLVPRADPLLDPGDLIGTLLARQTARREEREVGGIPLSRIELRPGARIGLGPSLRPADALFGQAIRLAGYAAERVVDGGAATVELSVDLRVERPMAEDYKFFAHLLDAGGKTVAQRDVIVLDPLRRTTSQMEAGTRIRLELSIVGETEALASGRAVGVGIYQLQPPGARLPLAPPAAEHRLILPLAN